MINSFFRSWNIIYLLIALSLITLGYVSFDHVRSIQTMNVRKISARDRIIKIDQMNSVVTSVIDQHMQFLISKKIDQQTAYLENLKLLENFQTDLASTHPSPALHVKLQDISSVIDKIVEDLKAILKNSQKNNGNTDQLKIDTQKSLRLLNTALDEARKIQRDEILAETSDSEKTTQSIGFTVILLSLSSAVLIFLAALKIERHKRQSLLNKKKIIEARELLEKQKFLISELVDLQHKVLTSAISQEKTMELIVDHTQRLTNADGCLIEFVDGDELVYEMGSGNIESLKDLRMKLKGSLSGLAITQQQAFISSDTEIDSRVNKKISDKASIRSMIVVPIRKYNRIIGVLKAFSQSQNHFNPYHIQVLTLASGFLTYVLDQTSELEDKRRVISTLKQTEAQLIRAKDAAEANAHAKSLFLANITREIRAPLNGILGVTELLGDTPLHSEQKDYLQIIDRSCESLLDITNDLMDFSKVESGKLILEKTDFNLIRLLEDLQKILVHSVKDRNIELTFAIPPDLEPFVKGDCGRLMQVLINLISNATPLTQNGQLGISVKTVPLENNLIDVEFQIHDNATGVTQNPKNTFENLLQIFNPIPPNTSTPYGTQGLGISICKHLVHLMNGKTGVRNQIGQGSQFLFNLKLERGHAEALSSPEIKNTFNSRVSSPQAHILVVDSNPINQKASLTTLAQLGFRAHAVSDGRLALKEVESQKYDLILMDCYMPEMDGYEITRQIRKLKNSQTATTPIVALTANALLDDREKCIASGMSDYLPRPLKMVDLQAMILKWLPHQMKLSLESSTSSFVDFNQLKLVTQANEQYDMIDFVEIIYAYLQTMPAFINSLEKNFKTQDWQSLKAAAHSIKGSSANIGAVDLSRLTQKIESLCLTHPQDIHLDEISSVRKIFDSVRKTLLDSMETAAQITSLNSKPDEGDTGSN